MSGILDTIITSLQDIVGNLIRALPGLIAGIIILFLARYAAKVTYKVARKVGKKAVPSASLQLLLEKTSYILTLTLGVLLAGVRETIQAVEGVLEHPQPEIDLVGFGDSSIDCVVRYWTIPQQHIVRRVQTHIPHPELSHHPFGESNRGIH